MKDDIIVPTVRSAYPSSSFEFLCKELWWTYMLIGLWFQVHFEILDGQAIPLPFGSQENWDSNLKTILDWSPFSTKEELMLQVFYIPFWSFLYFFIHITSVTSWGLFGFFPIFQHACFFSFLLIFLYLLLSQPMPLIRANSFPFSYGGFCLTSSL